MYIGAGYFAIEHYNAEGKQVKSLFKNHPDGSGYYDCQNHRNEDDVPEHAIFRSIGSVIKSFKSGEHAERFKRPFKNPEDSVTILASNKPFHVLSHNISKQSKHSKHSKHSKNLPETCNLY